VYDVETRALVQAVKRNHERVPEDFMFQLTDAEVVILRSQLEITKGGLKFRPRRVGGVQSPEKRAYPRAGAKGRGH
jgi:hypothetical protein